MNILLSLAFAGIAAIGNGLFALAQRQTAGVANGLLFVGASALVAALLAMLAAPFVGPWEAADMFKGNWRPMLMSGVGLFATYLGFNLLYSRFGASQYIVYAMLSIITTTVVVGFIWLREPVNLFHVASIFCAVAAVVLFTIGQSRV